MSRRARRPWRRRQGTASVEVVVMLPVFLVLFVASYYVHAAAAAAQQTGVRARACAWDKALRGCPGDTPALCVDLEPGDGGALSVERGGDNRIDELTKWPVLGPALESLFGRGVGASDAREVASIQGEALSVSRRVYLVCNPVPQAWDDKLKDLLCRVANGASLGLCKKD